jgi:hypothetical protein
VVRPPRDRPMGWACIFGADCPGATGAALVMPYADTDAMRPHIADIGRHVSRGGQAILVVDGTGWHTPGTSSCERRPPC